MTVGEGDLADFGGMYRVGDWESEGAGAANSRRILLDIYAGGRYTSLDLELRPTSVPAESRGVDWVDPIIGAKFVLPIAEQWHVQANGDVGGFGVESDFTWSATALIGFDFHLGDCPASLLAGYRAIGQDFTSGSGTDAFTWDVVQHGPIVGFSVEF